MLFPKDIEQDFRMYVWAFFRDWFQDKLISSPTQTCPKRAAYLKVLPSSLSITNHQKKSPKSLSCSINGRLGMRPLQWWSLKWAFTTSVYFLRWVPCPPLRSHVRATLIWSIACHSSQWLSPKTWSLNGDVWSGHCYDNCKKLSGALSPRPWLFWFQIWP